MDLHLYTMGVKFTAENQYYDLLLFVNVHFQRDFIINNGMFYKLTC